MQINELFSYELLLVLSILHEHLRTQKKEYEHSMSVIENHKIEHKKLRLIKSLLPMTAGIINIATPI